MSCKLHQRLHARRPSIPALPPHIRNRQFRRRAVNAPSPLTSCSPLSRTAHHPPAVLCTCPTHDACACARRLPVAPSHRHGTHAHTRLPYGPATQATLSYPCIRVPRYVDRVPCTSLYSGQDQHTPPVPMLSEPTRQPTLTATPTAHPPPQSIHVLARCARETLHNLLEICNLLYDCNVRGVLRSTIDLLAIY